MQHDDDSHAAASEDGPSMASSDSLLTPQQSTKLLLSPDEERILALYDRLQALRLEIALAREFLEHKQGEGAASTGGEGRGPSSEGTEQDKRDAIKTAQEGLLESRAKYVLQKTVVESVMMVAPIVKSVHSGSNTSPIEGDLYPFIEQRDNLSVAVAKKSTELQSTLGELSHVRTETLTVSRRNVELAGELVRLAEQARKRNEPRRMMNGGVHSDEEGEMRRAVKRSRQGWKTMKGVASAMVAASGVDWAADDVLREIVLDAEDE